MLASKFEHALASASDMPDTAPEPGLFDDDDDDEEEAPQTEPGSPPLGWREDAINALEPLKIRRTVFLEAYHAITEIMFNVAVPEAQIADLAAARDALLTILMAYDSEGKNLIEIVKK
ncbi:MAG: hypothetical protein Q8P20_00630 [bacterium]|nr:hypothetical protein [bacterium]